MLYWVGFQENTLKNSHCKSHGGSGKQALEVANGLPADVVTLALEGDVDAVKDAGLIDEGYTKEFPLDSSPYTSTIVFLVKKGNSKDITDREMCFLRGKMRHFGDMKTTYGVYYVFGNHDKGYYPLEYRGYDGDDLISELEKNKVHVMQYDVELEASCFRL